MSETTNERPLQLAVLVSGGGTTLQNLIDVIAAGQLNAQIKLVIGSRPNLAGLQRASDAKIISEPIKDMPELYPTRPASHMQNFVDCIKSRKDPICPVETGHRSACVGHLIVIALRTGRKLQWDPVTEMFTGGGAKEGNAHLAREMRKPYDYGFVG